MANPTRFVTQRLVPLMTALSIGISSVPVALAGPGDVNSTNTNANVQNGTYYNTSGNATNFVNGKSLTVDGRLRFLEVNGGGVTGNGGNANFTAPFINIKSSGIIDARAISGSGGYGGNINFNANMLYNAGRIFSGAGGGIVFNVGSAVFAPGSQVTAPGGTVAINSSGPVDIQADSQRAAVIDVSGRQIGTVDSGVINIQGSVVNVDGVVRANGLGASDGGTIRIVSTGTGGTGDNSGACIANCAISKAESQGVIDQALASELTSRLSDLADNNNGDVVIGATGVVEANGGNATFFNGAQKAGDGGVIEIAAKRDLVVKNDGFNGGLIAANGGDGYGFSYSSPRWVQTGRFPWQGYFDWETNYVTADGGNGGMIVASAGRDINFGGSAHAYGGNGYQNNRPLTGDELALVGGKNLPDGYIFDNQDNVPGGIGGNGGAIGFGYGRRFNNDKVDALNGRELDPADNTKTLFSYNQIDASGGHTGLNAGKTIDGKDNPYGGIVLFSGFQNPNRLDNVSVYRGLGPNLSTNLGFDRFGTVVLPDASSATAIAELEGVNNNFKAPNTVLTIDQLQQDEVLVGRNTLALFSTGDTPYLDQKFNEATVRSAEHAYQGGGYESQISGAGSAAHNLFVSSVGGERLEMTIPNQLGNNTVFLRDTAAGENGLYNLTSLIINNSARNGNSRLINNDYWVVGGDSKSGGQIALLSDGNITNNNQLAVKGQVFDGSVTLATNRSIINNGFIGGNAQSDFGSSVILKACRDILNDGLWRLERTADDVYSGISQVGGGQIDTSGRLAGGRVDMVANNNILNLGSIYADSGQGVAGTIYSHAGNNNLNFGSITASSYGDPASEAARGGSIRLHGNNLAANVDLTTLVDPSLYGRNHRINGAGVERWASEFGVGQLEAKGGSTGGTVALSAGGTCGAGCENNNPTETVTGAGGFVNGRVSDFLNSGPVNGFGISQNTPPVTEVSLSVDPGISESALNFGNIDTRSANGGGEVWLVGNNQAGMGAYSVINDVKVDYDAILSSSDPAAAFQAFQTAMNDNGSVKLVAGTANGKSAVEAVFCADDIPSSNPNGDVPGDGYDFPNDFTLPGASTPPGSSPDTPGFSLLGLFQEGRNRYFQDQTPRQPAPIIIGFEQPGMFMAQAYEPITQEILALALLEYNRVLADPTTATQGGETHVRAAQLTRLYLQDAGVDQEVAQALVEKINEGSLKAHQNVLAVLTDMANPTLPESQPSLPPGENVEQLRQ